MNGRIDNGENYAEHIYLCNSMMQSGPVFFKRGVSFVLATIQQQLETVPAILESFDDMAAGSPFAFGSKARGLDYLDSHGNELFWACMHARHDTEKLLSLFLRVPGLGLPKAGFACQLFAGTVGCIDSHNIKLYDVPLSALRYSKSVKSEKIKSRKRADYIALCRGLGGSRFLWGTWCEYKASHVPDNWTRGGLSVSRLHIECINRAYYHNAPLLFGGVNDAPRFSADFQTETE